MKDAAIIVKEKQYKGFLLYSGLIFDPFDPKPEDFSIVDIAKGLSSMPRFGGHLNKFYSVAEHSIWLVKELMKHNQPNKILRGALLHDSDEGLGMMDMPTPIKSHENMRFYRETQNNIMSVVAKKYNFEWPLNPIVHAQDMLAVQWERDNDKKVVKSRDIEEVYQEFIQIFNLIKND